MQSHQRVTSFQLAQKACVMNSYFRRNMAFHSKVMLSKDKGIDNTPSTEGQENSPQTYVTRKKADNKVNARSPET
jgi:hypothetical protein